MHESTVRADCVVEVGASGTVQVWLGKDRVQLHYRPDGSVAAEWRHDPERLFLPDTSQAAAVVIPGTAQQWHLDRPQRPDPAAGGVVWLGDLSGFQVVDGRTAFDYPALTHRCGWDTELVPADAYLPNVVERAITHRVWGCAPPVSRTV